MNSNIILGVAAVTLLVAAYSIYDLGNAKGRLSGAETELTALRSHTSAQIEQLNGKIANQEQQTNLKFSEAPKDAIRKIGSTCKSARLSIGVNGQMSCNDYCAKWDSHPYQGSCLMAQRLGNTNEAPSDLSLSWCGAGENEEGITYNCVCC